MSKLFSELSKDEATQVVRQIVRSSNSEDEIKRRLTEAGFDGEAAAICSQRCGPMFQAEVMVWGPNREVISA
jgi:hypothetical protein